MIVALLWTATEDEADRITEPLTLTEADERTSEEEGGMVRLPTIDTGSTQTAPTRWQDDGRTVEKRFFLLIRKIIIKYQPWQ